MQREALAADGADPRVLQGVEVHSDGFEAERMIRECLEFYNCERPHSALGGATLEEALRAAVH